VHERYRAIWQMIGKMLEATGKREESAHAFATAQQLGPHP
jgi:cytochrome c-type biogenesis protein CcmH/NrfG